MKLLSVFSFILGAGIAVSQVGAAPPDVVGQTKSNAMIRVGLNPAVAPHNSAFPLPQVSIATWVPMVKPNKSGHGCMRKLRNKAKKLSNWVLVMLHIRPAPAHPQIISLPPLSGVPDQALPFTPTFVPAPHFAVHNLSGEWDGHKSARRPFSQRLTRALMMLSPWEGRAVAFILGCGIGVLVRMVWVLAVLVVRSIRGKKQREEFIEDEVLFEEEEYLLAPPQYTAPPQVVAVSEKKDEKEAPRNA